MTTTSRVAFLDDHVAGFAHVADQVRAELAQRVDVTSTVLLPISSPQPYLSSWFRQHAPPAARAARSSSANARMARACRASPGAKRDRARGGISDLLRPACMVDRRRIRAPSSSRSNGLTIVVGARVGLFTRSATASRGDDQHRQRQPARSVRSTSMPSRFGRPRSSSSRSYLAAERRQASPPLHPVDREAVRAQRTPFGNHSIIRQAESASGQHPWASQTRRPPGKPRTAPCNATERRIARLSDLFSNVRFCARLCPNVVSRIRSCRFPIFHPERPRARACS